MDLKEAKQFIVEKVIDTKAFGFSTPEEERFIQVYSPKGFHDSYNMFVPVLFSFTPSLNFDLGDIVVESEYTYNKKEQVTDESGTTKYLCCCLMPVVSAYNDNKVVSFICDTALPILMDCYLERFFDIKVLTPNFSDIRWEVLPHTTLDNIFEFVYDDFSELISRVKKPIEIERKRQLEKESSDEPPLPF